MKAAGAYHGRPPARAPRYSVDEARRHDERHGAGKGHYSNGTVRLANAVAHGAVGVIYLTDPTLEKPSTGNPSHRYPCLISEPLYSFTLLPAVSPVLSPKDEMPASE